MRPRKPQPALSCERHPPEGWPGEPCRKAAKYDVLYQLKTEAMPRGICLCLEHLAELRQLDERGMLSALHVLEVSLA